MGLPSAFESDCAPGLSVYKCGLALVKIQTVFGMIYRADWWYVDMLNALLCLQLSIDLRGGGGCSRKDQQVLAMQNLFVARNLAPDLPAAAAGSTAVFAGASPAGLRGSRLSGLRVRVDSDCLAEGDRERRSNRERRGSGSVWSKRERLTRRSSSVMARVVCQVEESCRGAER